MNKFKNSRSYRIITSLTSNDTTESTSQDTTPSTAVNQAQYKYTQLFNEITNGPDVSNYGVLPEDELTEVNEQRVLLDISNSTNFRNTESQNNENISTCTEVDDAYQNLMQIEDNCELDSRYLNSVLLNSTIDENRQLQEPLPPEGTFNNIQQESVDVNTSDVSESILSANITLSQVSADEHLRRPNSEMSTNHRDESHSQNLMTPESIIPINENRTGRPKKGRKRKYPYQTREIRKKLCETNKKYISQKGKEVNPREFIDFHCKDGCHEKISVMDRKAEFSKFWELGFEGKNLYINSNVKVVPVNRKRNKTSIKRNNTRIYSLKNIVICAKMFIKTLGISSARIDRYLKKCSGLEKIEDKRGKLSKSSHKLPPHVEQSVIQHIDRFPKYKSHYCREQTERMFLPPDMTLSKMYELYLSEENSSNSIKQVSFASYKKIFYSKFNLQRKKPQKDTCNKCDLLAVKIRETNAQEAKLKLEKEREDHHKEAEDARAFKKQDLDLAKTCQHIETLTFDMEKTLPLPRIPTNIVFYKRQLWLYNCGVHSGKTGKGFCYVWVEGTAGRGAQEVGSTLRKHISLQLDSNVKELILWSDSCGGQNRNIKLTLLLLALLEEHESIEKITLRFMVPGHSFLENDSDFSDIESALKTHSRIYTPQDYIDVMTSCRKRNKLIAVKMEKEDFVGVSGMMKKIVNRKKDTEGNSVSWLKTKEINIFKNKPGRIFLSTTHGGQFHEVNLQKRLKRGESSHTLKLSSHYEQLWPEGKPISQPKLDDIKSLLHLIPSDARQYYENLTGSNDLEDDVDGFDGNIDFEIEDEG